MEQGTATKQNRRAAFARVGATSVAFFIPIIVAAAYLNLGQTCCRGNCPPPKPPDFLVSRDLADEPISASSMSVSVDGTRVAYAPEHYPDIALSNQLFFYDFASGERRRIDLAATLGLVYSQRVSGPVLTADGSFVAFEHSFSSPYYTQEIWFGATAPTTSQTYEVLVSVNSPDGVNKLSMSGDGSTITYNRYNSGSLWDSTHIEGPNGVVSMDGIPGGAPISLDGQWVILWGYPESQLQRVDGSQSISIDLGPNPSMNADASLVAYKDTDYSTDPIQSSIYIFDRLAGTHQLVSLDNYGSPGSCEFPTISPDGNRVMFWCKEPLTSHGARRQIYVRDLEENITYLASVTENREPSDDTGSRPRALDTSGRYAFINSFAENFASAPGDGNGYLYRVPDSYWEACDDQLYLPQATTCGSGPCEAHGTTSCVSGRIVDDCEPADGQTGIPEDICNGIDDDCDGEVDEDYAFQG